MPPSFSCVCYLLTIYRLTQHDTAVRSVDVARCLNVTRASVAKMLRALISQGMVEKEPYGRIRLTFQGQRQSESLYQEFLLLQNYLTQCLHVPQPEAEQDAVRCLYWLSRQTRSCMAASAAFLPGNPA
ncbi:metal-dependent transcriptional regulator [Angelakisella massiliensis]|uniref:metal-dependent transcriptional regulator n=1 Tax=Angelakisella massiliensis TaxID=1871018 RepID=UPI0008F8D82E|nr:metal-dependent transcriptional regulator [Angelakisella massiliensis]